MSLLDIDKNLFEEACVETDFSIREMLGWIEDLRANKEIPASFIATRFLQLFEQACDEAEEWIYESGDDSCPACHDNGISCSVCAGTGKSGHAQRKADRVAELADYLYDQRRDKEMMDEG